MPECQCKWEASDRVGYLFCFNLKLRQISRTWSRIHLFISDVNLVSRNTDAFLYRGHIIFSPFPKCPQWNVETVCTTHYAIRVSITCLCVYYSLRICLFWQHEHKNTISSMPDHRLYNIQSSQCENKLLNADGIKILKLLRWHYELTFPDELVVP